MPKLAENIKFSVPMGELCFELGESRPCFRLETPVKLSGVGKKIGEASLQAAQELAGLNGLKFMACDKKRRCMNFAPSVKSVTEALNLVLFELMLPDQFWNNRSIDFTIKFAPAVFTKGWLYMVDEGAQNFEIFFRADSTLSFFQYIGSGNELLYRRERAVVALKRSAVEFLKSGYDYPSKRVWQKKNDFKIIKDAPDYVCANPFETMQRVAGLPCEQSHPDLLCQKLYSLAYSSENKSVAQCVSGASMVFNLGRTVFVTNNIESSPLAYFDRGFDGIFIGAVLADMLFSNENYVEKILAHECEHRRFDKGYARSEVQRVVADAMSLAKDELINDGYHEGVVEWFTRWYNFRTVVETFDSEINAYSAGFLEEGDYSVTMINKRLQLLTGLFPKESSIYLIEFIKEQVLSNPSIDPKGKAESLKLINTQLELLASDF